MSFFLITYTIIFAVIALIIFIELVSHKIIFANSRTIQKIFGHPMLRYSIRRIGSALISVLLAIIVTFFLIRASTDIMNKCNTDLFGGTGFIKQPELAKARCAIYAEEMGFAGNPFQQLLNFLYSILPFPKILCNTSYELDNGVYYIVSEQCRAFVMDLGKMWNKQIAGVGGSVYVLDFIIEKMGVSFPIGIMAVIVEMALGYPLGILMAKYKDGAIDHIGNAYIVTVSAIPGVAYYYIWMALLTGLMMLPSQYDVTNFLSWLPPVLTMGFTGMTGIAFWVRRYMVDEFSSDYVRFARAKGLSEGRIMATHVLRNAIVPLVRTFPSAILGALMGSFFIEKLYNIQGIGNFLVAATNAKEIFAIQGIVIITALISIISYLLGDIVTAIADPRIRFAKD